MESTNISLKLTDLAVLCQQILVSGNALEQLRRLFADDGNLLEDYAVQRHIPTKLLYIFFDRALDSKEYIDLFIAFLDLSDASSVTEKLLDHILACKYPYLKSRCVVSLSHKDLPVALLEKLCKTNICFESYFEMIIKVYQDAAYSLKDLCQYLSMFYESPYSYMWSELVCEVLCTCASSVEKEQLMVNQRIQDA